jgi:hypothetical protein
LELITFIFFPVGLVLLRPGVDVARTFGEFFFSLLMPASWMLLGVSWDNGVYLHHQGTGLIVLTEGGNSSSSSQ